ncbi:hypothetical protein ACWCPL_30880, partial [Streptomyces sp. NPDC001948]
MTSEASTLVTIDATTTLLEAELPRLEQHQQSLEKELATVTERLESVRTALTALRALSGTPVTAPAPTAGADAAEDIKAADSATAEAAEAADTGADAGTASIPAARIPQQAQDSVDSVVQAEAPQEQAAATPARRTARKAPGPDPDVDQRLTVPQPEGLAQQFGRALVVPRL